MKILLTLLAVAICTEATISLGSLLGLNHAPRAVPVPAPVSPGYASYYRHALAPASAHIQPGYTSYYRQAPVPAPSPVQHAAQSAPIVRVIQPIVYVPRPSPATVSYYRHPAPVVPSSFTQTQVQQSMPKTYVQPASHTEVSIVPSQSFSFSNANSAAAESPLSISYANGKSADSTAGGVQSDYTVEMVQSEGHSYSMPVEQITLEETVAPVTDIEVSENEPASDSASLQNLKLDFRGPNEVEAVPVAVEASAAATASVDEVVNEAPLAVETPAAADEPIVVEPIEPTVQTNVAATAEAVVDEPFSQVAPVQPLATVTLDQERITQQILREAIPNVNRQVAPQIIQQAIPLIVDRAVPQIVYQAGQQSAQQQQFRKQAESVQIVTPFNQQQQQQKQDEKVFVMYATSIPQEQFNGGLNLRGQYDESENLVVPIGNRKQHSGSATAAAHANHAHNEQKVVLEKALDFGSQLQEERRDVGNVNQQITGNFQRENLAYQQKLGGVASASNFAGAGSGLYRNQNQHQQQHNQYHQ